MATKNIAHDVHNSNGNGDKRIEYVSTNNVNAKNEHVVSDTNNGKTWYSKNTQVFFTEKYLAEYGFSLRFA